MIEKTMDGNHCRNKQGKLNHPIKWANSSSRLAFAVPKLFYLMPGDSQNLASLGHLDQTKGEWKRLPKA